MIQFVLIASVLIVLALLFVLVPLLRQSASIPVLGHSEANLALFHQQLLELTEDKAAGVLEQYQYDAARRDLERMLVANTGNLSIPIPIKSGRWVIPLLTVLIPLLATGIYLKAGNYKAIINQVAETTAESNTPDMPTMISLVERLATKMQSNPDNLQGWLMLGRSSLAIGKGQQAIDAYAQALRLSPKDPEIMLAYANAITQVTPKFDAKATELIATALALDPNNLQGLWLQGLVELQQGATAKAIEHWTLLEAKLPPDSNEAQTIRRLIIQAKQSKKTASLPP